jgi:hypothetical protein
MTSRSDGLCCYRPWPRGTPAICDTCKAICQKCGQRRGCAEREDY